MKPALNESLLQPCTPRNLRRLALVLCMGFGLPLQAAGQDPAIDAARLATVHGPRDVPFEKKAVLHLPGGYHFIPGPQARPLLEREGNRVGENFMGLVSGDAMAGFVVIQYQGTGHVSDEDAKDWNANDLLKNIKEGTAEANKERTKLGVPALEVLGWIEAPKYDATTHRLVWALLARNKDVPPAQQTSSVNYNTYLLGREGYYSLNLVTDMNSVTQDKPAAQTLLAALEFQPGQTYADYNATTDRTAEYGLAALVGGVAAKKLGLLAILGVLLAKAGKLVLLGGLALLGGVAKLFGGKKKTPATPPEDAA